MATATTNSLSINVGMGKIQLAQGEQELVCILGSCVGVAIFCSRTKQAALAHVVLPDSAGRTGSPGKFADTAIPAIVDQLLDRGAKRSAMTAKIVGAASMFKGTGPIQIGESNVTATVAALDEARIKLVGREIGGQKGRRVVVDPNTAQVVIEVQGNVTKVL